VFILTSGVIGFALLGNGTPTVVALGLALAVPTVLAAAVAVVATRVRGNGPRRDLRLEWCWRDVGIGLAFGFGGLFLTLAASAVYISIVGPDVTSAVGDIFTGQRAGPVAAVLILLIVVIIAPFCEEIIYRGLLWGAVEKLGGGRWIAFGVTTLVFALAHFEFTRTPLLLVISIPIGLARLYTGRLLASIVAHQVNNLLPGLALMAALLGVVPT
jgi:membrane protease YdiL (CAAX protease family)